MSKGVRYENEDDKGDDLYEKGWTSKRPKDLPKDLSRTTLITGRQRQRKRDESYVKK